MPRAPAGDLVMTGHDYLSTACLHDVHDYCAAPVVSRDGGWATVGPSYSAHLGDPKSPARCKFCSAPCRCLCHDEWDGVDDA